MSKIFDNIENHLDQALKNALEFSHCSDFCVGYFNYNNFLFKS